MFRFTIRDLVLLTLVVAMGVTRVPDQALRAAYCPHRSDTFLFHYPKTPAESRLAFLRGFLRLRWRAAQEWPLRVPAP